MDSSAYGQNVVNAFNSSSRHRNNLQVERQRLQYQVDVISNQVKEISGRLRDLECAAQAPVVSSSGWNRNTHDLFVKNLNQSSTCLQQRCNQLDIQRIELVQRIDRLDQQIGSLST